MRFRNFRDCDESLSFLFQLRDDHGVPGFRLRRDRNSNRTGSMTALSSVGRRIHRRRVVDFGFAAWASPVRGLHNSD